MLWVPGSVAEAILNEEASNDEAARVAHVYRRLHALDPRLDLWPAHRDFPEEEIRNGFWYVVRRNENGTVSMWEVRNPDGTYREPDERIVEAFQRMDASRTDQNRERERGLRREAAERESKRRRELDDLHEQFKEKGDFAFRVQVPIKKGLAA